MSDAPPLRGNRVVKDGGSCVAMAKRNVLYHDWTCG